MEMTGERRIPAPRDKVWQALNDPAVLKDSLPGCEFIEAAGDNQYNARLALKIGPMYARFSGTVTLSDIDPPNGYTLAGEGQGGVAGFAKGTARVRLAEDGPDATVLTYHVNAQVGGKIAQLGARLIDSTAKNLSDQFFTRFANRVAPPPPAPEEAAPVAAEAPAKGLAGIDWKAELAAQPLWVKISIAVWVLIVLMMVL